VKVHEQLVLIKLELGPRLG